MPKRLFISKPFEELTLKFVGAVQQKGYVLEAVSFLEFKEIPFTVDQEYGVIFFSSTRAVHYFLQKTALTDDIKIAAVGSETAKAAEQFGYQVDFIGDKSGLPDESAEKFRIWCGDNKVLFPVSDISLLSYSKVLPPDQVQIIQVYSTVIVSRIVNEADVYVFTSPSNVIGFLALNAITTGATIIAWGKSTEAELMKRGLKSNYILETSTLKELLEYL